MKEKNQLSISSSSSIDQRRLRIRDLSHPLNPTTQRVQQNATQVMATDRLRIIMTSRNELLYSDLYRGVSKQGTHHHDLYALQQM